VSILVVTGERGSRTISAQMTDRPAETLLALLSKAAIRRCFARCADEPIGEESKPRRRDILSARSGAVTPSYTSRDSGRSPVASKRKTRAEAQVWSSAVRGQSPKLVGTGRLFALFLLILARRFADLFA
jgi:hypothetical protein